MKKKRSHSPIFFSFIFALLPSSSFILAQNKYVYRFFFVRTRVFVCMLNLFSHLEIHPKKRSVLVTSSHRVGIQCVALSNDIRFFSMSVNAKKNGATNKRNTCLNECNKYLFSLMLLGCWFDLLLLLLLLFFPFVFLA